MLRQGHVNVKVSSRQCQGKFMARSRQGQGKVKARFRQGKSKVKETSRQGPEARSTTVIASMSIR